MKKIVPYLSLFASFSTLICCALPALLVSVGMGAALAATISAVPQLVWFSEHKAIVFSGAGFMLAATALIRGLTRETSCPTDPALAAACMRGRRYSTVIFSISVVLYLIGAFFAFVAPYLIE